MAAELIMIGPERPVTHMPHHDLKSIFYVLMGVSVLYNRPYNTKSEDELSECFNTYFNTHCPSLQKTFMIQSELGWLTSICERFSNYFKPLRPLLDTFHERIDLPMTYVNGSFAQRFQAPITHDEMAKYLIDMLYNLPDEAWVAEEWPMNVKGGRDVFELDNFELDLPLGSHVSGLENSSETESLSPTEPLRISCPVSICPISGPGFITSSTSSNSTRRLCSGSDDAEYVDPGPSHVKCLHFNVDTTIANCMNPQRSTTGRFISTAPVSLPLPFSHPDL